MDAKILYRIIFVGNEPYKNRRKRLNSRMKRQVHQGAVRINEDDYWNMLMLNDLSEFMPYYVRKSISGVFKILKIKILRSKLEFQNPRSRNFS